MKGWRDTEEDREEFKIFRHRYFSLGAACYWSTGPDVIRGWSTEEERRRGKWGKKSELVPISVRYQEIKSHL